MIKLKVEGQCLNIKERMFLGSGSQDYVTATFEFDDDWNGLTKTAVFYQNTDNVYHAVLVEDSCIIPYEALADGDKRLFVGVFGIVDTKRITTNFVNVFVYEGGYGDGLTPDEPSEDIYAQIIAIMEQQSIDAQTTFQYQETTKGYMDNAESYKNSAEEYMDTTEGYKDLTYGYKEEAKTSETNAGLEAERALNNILNGVSTHNQDITSHPSILEDIREVEAIARGRATAYVFDTYEDMLDWLEIPDNVETLVIGDNLYIRDIGVKDYWWDGITYQELEAEAPDLTNYYTKSQVDYKMPILITRAEYDALVANGTVIADRTYDIIEEV